MKNFNRDIHALSQKEKLTASERNDLRARVAMFMEYHPLTEKDTNVAAVEASPFLGLLKHLDSRMTASAALFVAVLTLIPFAAERAEPGDALYAVKVGVNEPVQASFIDKPTDKITFEVERIERRIAEARLLAEEGALDAEAEEKIAIDIAERTESVQKTIAELKITDEAGAEAARIAFSSSLEASNVVVETIGSISTTTATSSDLRKTFATALTRTESRDTIISLEGKRRISTLINEERARAEALFAAIEGTLTEAERTGIRKYLDDFGGISETSITEGAQGTSTASTTDIDAPAATSTLAKGVASTSIATLDAEVSIETPAAISAEIAATPTEEALISVVEEEVTAEIKNLTATGTTKLTAAPDLDSPDISVLASIKKLILYMTDAKLREIVTIETLIPTIAPIKIEDEQEDASSVPDESIDTQGEGSDTVSEGTDTAEEAATTPAEPVAEVSALLQDDQAQ